jgi:hypothetical protein
MNTQREFPDLIKAGLKVGDTVYSYLYGEGKVSVINNTPPCSIVVFFTFGDIVFKSNGLEDSDFLCPAIHLSPWNPIAGEPFPFPKFEPIVGGAYAFWQDGQSNFRVGKLIRILANDQNNSKSYEFGNVADNYLYKHCAPIAEAMQIFGFDKPQQP